MKSLSNYISEKLIINKNFKNQNHLYVPNNKIDLINILIKIYKKEGPGTTEKPIDLNIIDVSNVDNFYEVFLSAYLQGADFECIDVFDWDLNGTNSLESMFYHCSKLWYIKGLSNWNVEHITSFKNMFCKCVSLYNIGDISTWKPKSLTNMDDMFKDCLNLRSIGNILEWEKTNHNIIIPEIYKRTFDLQ